MAGNERLPYPEKIYVTRFSRISGKKGIPGKSLSDCPEMLFIFICYYFLYLFMTRNSQSCHRS